MADFGVSEAGFTRKRLDDIRTSLHTQWRAIFGPNVDLSAGSPDEQLIAPFAGAMDEGWQALEAIFHSFRPSQATGAALSALVRLNGITRKPATKSTVTLRLIGNPGTSIPAGQLVELADTGEQFVTLDPALIIVSTFDVAAEAVNPGPAIVAASSSWNILTPVAGWGDVSNPTAGVIGEAAETDAALRLRREVSTEKTASNVLDALYGKILNIAGVTDARILNNETGVADVNGVPPHSYRAIVEGGTQADIAEVIWLNHPSGIGLDGAITENYVDSQGVTQAIKFSRPTLVPIFADVVLSVTADYPSDGDARIKQAIVDYAAGLLVAGEEFGIGDNVLRSRLFAALNSVPGHSVTTFTIGKSLGTLAASDISIAIGELATFDVADITVTS